MANQSVIHKQGEIINPIMMMPCHPGWKAVFETDPEEADTGVFEEDVVMWGLFECRTTCTIEGEDEPHNVTKEPNFIAGLIRDEFSEGGLRPARPCEGLIGYRAPGESLAAFLKKMGACLEGTPKALSTVDGALN